MKVALSAEAEKQAEEIDEWWRDNRGSSPDLFEVELSAAFERIVAGPKTVVYEQGDIAQTVYRMLMPRTRHHVYYVLRGDTAFVLAVWGAVKERGPTLVGE